MSEAALRAAVPPHFSKDSPCWAIFSELKGIRNKLEQIAHAMTHSVCVSRARVTHLARARRRATAHSGHVGIAVVCADEACAPPCKPQGGPAALPPGASNARGRLRALRDDAESLS